MANKTIQRLVGISLALAVLLSTLWQTNLYKVYALVSSSDVVHIKTATELAAIGGAQSAGKSYVLDNDITLTTEWVPINDFRGTFDGQGYSINNLFILPTIKRENGGLFGYINANSNTINVTIKNVVINIGLQGISSSSSANSVVGGLIGYCYSNYGGTVKIENCAVIGDVSSHTGSSTSSSSAGGLIGRCVTYSTVTNDTALIIEDCYTIGTTSSFSIYTSTNTFGSFAGGLIGDCVNVFGTTIKNCYSMSEVLVSSNSTGSSAGGLIGRSESLDNLNVQNCYATGDVSSFSPYSYSGGLVGLRVGNNTQIITNCYRLSAQSVVGTTIDTSGTPLTSDQMKQQSSFVGWDFDTVWAIAPNVRNGYPHLRSEGVNGEDDNVIHITTPQELVAIGGAQSEGKYYILDNDINLVAEWIPISDFRGTFDGNGYSISNLYITNNSNIQFAGLFGRVDATTSGVIIKNVGVNIGQLGINTIAAHTGGLVGALYSNSPNATVLIENCYTTGNVSSNTSSWSNIGGLIGRVETSSNATNTITILNSYSKCNVSAYTYTYNTFVGGILGNYHNNASKITIKNCYATGDIFSR